MDPTEPVKDLPEQMAELSRRITGVDENLIELRKQVNGLGERVTNQGERLEQRIAAQGERISRVEQDLAVIKSNYSTQADVLAAKNSVIMWVVSAIFLAQLLPNLVKWLGG